MRSVKEVVYRLRIRDYRFLFKIVRNNLMILIFNAGNRKDIYN